MPANPNFLFLDKVATIQLQAVSDILWTEATGKRTPIGGLGTFWDVREQKKIWMRNVYINSK
jgi:hypothetical protein